MADTVLIVDDDEAVLTMLYKVIRSNGIEADTVASGEEALERTAQRTYDLILLDVNLMGMDGFQVVQTLRQRGLPGADSLITAGPFTYNTSTLRFYKNGVEIPLSAKENAMMKLFIDNVNRIFSKDMLYDLLWGEAIIDENAIMVYVNRLRAKIEEDPARPAYIQTVRGLGYRFVV